MQRLLMLLLALCGQVSAMEVINKDASSQSVAVMMAAWVVTPQTVLGEHDQIIISKYPNGMHGIKHFSRPNGLKETRCEQVSVLEVTKPTHGSIQALLLKNLGDAIELHAPQEAWYKHPVATHGFAILSTILAISALYR